MELDGAADEASMMVGIGCACRLGPCDVDIVQLQWEKTKGCRARRPGPELSGRLHAGDDGVLGRRRILGERHAGGLLGLLHDPRARPGGTPQLWP